MPPPAVVNKPFPEYRWRWAVLTPSEGLNDPQVFLGVLRAMRQVEGQLAKSPSLHAALQQVEAQITGPGQGITLSRSPERNLLRNSQQYWTALGVLRTTKGGIKLTSFGQQVADGLITREAFAATIVKTMMLPNEHIEDAAIVQKWGQAGLVIHPLALILDVIDNLFRSAGQAAAYLTPKELIRVAIPLAGIKTSAKIIAQNVSGFRANPAQYSHFPDCAPGDNDARMAREFLLFLAYQGFLQQQPAPSIMLERFTLNESTEGEVANLLAASVPLGALEIAADNLSSSGAIVSAERRRRLANVLTRPQQARFRRDVLNASSGKCLLTGVTITEVLQACHIQPVEDNGSDHVSNGICLRSDLHDLFDAGHLRIFPNGTVEMSSAMKKSGAYAGLPQKIALPNSVSKAALEWRVEYK